MKYFLFIGLAFLSFYASAQITKDVKVLTTKKIQIPVTSNKKGGVKNGSGKEISKDIKNQITKPKIIESIGILNAKNFVRTLPDGTKLTTSLFIKKNFYENNTAKFFGEPKSSIKPKSQTETNENGWLCKSEQIKISLDDESFMNAANEQQSSKLYPGALYSFDNFFNGSFKADKSARRPFRIISSAPGMTGSVFETITNPDEGTIKNAINILFNRMKLSNAISGYKSKIYECNSLAEQMIKINGGGGAYGFSANFGMETKSKNQYRNFLIDCTQEMYSISAEMPDSGLFVNSADAAKDGLMVIGNVTYGQRVLVSLTTRITSNEMGTKFDARYTGFGASANFGLESLTKEASEETTVKIYIVGGTNEGFIETTKSELMNKLNQYFKNTNLQNAKPISYQFKNMNDEVVQSQSATDYFPVRRCIPSPPPGVNSADIKWRITVNLSSITNETDRNESIHLGIHQIVTMKNTESPVKHENFNAKNILGYLIYWGGSYLPVVPYEEPRTFKGYTDPQKTMSFIISQKDAENGAFVTIVSNYIAMVTTRIGGKTNESSLNSEQKFEVLYLTTKLKDTRYASINFNNRVFKFQYNLSAQKL